MKIFLGLLMGIPLTLISLLFFYCVFHNIWLSLLALAGVWSYMAVKMVRNSEPGGGKAT
jgi:hypothetical protein